MTAVSTQRMYPSTLAKTARNSGINVYGGPHWEPLALKPLCRLPCSAGSEVAQYDVVQVSWYWHGTSIDQCLR